MKNSKLVLIGFLNSIGVGVYVLAISLIIRNGERIFGQMNNFLGPAVFLLLFVLSASITGALVLGRPVWLYFENRKAEAIKLFSYTIVWLFVLTLVTFLVQIIK